MTRSKSGRFQSGSEEARNNGSKGGKIGGASSPTNFKNNKDLARQAGLKSAEARKKKRLEAEQIEQQMIDQQDNERTL